MPPFRHWAELPPELLCRVGDSLELKCYSSARGACTAWRGALAPPCPSLLVVPDDARQCFPSAASIPARRTFELKSTPSGVWPQCVGSSNGWLALSVQLPSGRSVFSLFNPITATEIVLPPLIDKSSKWAFHESSKWVSKLVFKPNPARDDFIAAAICGMDRLAYVTAGARRWAVLDPVRLADGDQFTDMVYHEKEDRVYCLTSFGDVHVLRLPERRRLKPHVLRLPERRRREPHVLRLPERRRREPIMVYNPLCSSTVEDRAALDGDDLNAPATVEPLLPLLFDPACSFVPPYNKISGFTSTKNLVFCDANLYQIWRNSTCTMTVQLPGGDRRRLEVNEVFVMRFFPRRELRWDAVTDLGGYSVFVGRNNAVSMSNAAGVPGLKGNCVYWIGGRGRDQGMVFVSLTWQLGGLHLFVLLGLLHKAQFAGTSSTTW